MGYLATLLLTVLFIVLVLWVFIRIGTPVYRVERSNVIKLLKMVRDGRATESDWDVFIGVPIRHNPELEAVRERCQEIAEREFIGSGGLLFTRQGLAELEDILRQLVQSGGHAG